MATKDLYELQLHETVIFPVHGVGTNLTVTRVPGGWLYDTHSTCNGPQTTFVPFCEEFRQGQSWQKT